MLSANLSALVPQHVLAGLHTTRLEGATINQLRMQVASLEDQAARMQRENGVLKSRFTLFEQSTGEVTRRVGALEVSLPTLLEALPNDADIDRSAVTASIGDEAPVTFDTEGGSVSVQQKPLPTGDETILQPLPPIAVTIAPDPEEFGIALGPPVAVKEAAAAWKGLNVMVGTLLLGLGPLVVELDDGSEVRIVAGPLSDAGQAAGLCTAMKRAEIACEPVPFVGEPLPD